MGARISADYTLIQDVLRVEIDTDGRQLQDAFILSPEGRPVRAATVEYPPLAPPSTALQVGLGFGAGNLGSGGAVPVGTGTVTGLAIGVPIGEGRLQGSVLATFSAPAVGPGPWQLRIKLAGLDEMSIVLGGPRPAGGSR